MRAFSEEEKLQIKKILMDSCLDCWGLYGFSKTSVSQLCQMSNISVGAFYKLYDCKERLFYDASQEYEMEMYREFESHLQIEPNKKGVISGVKAIIRKAMDSVWFYKISNDISKITRKIQLDIKAETESVVAKTYQPLFERYNIKLIKSAEETVMIIAMLYGGIFFKDVFPVDITGYIDFIVESTVSQLVK